MRRTHATLIAATAAALAATVTLATLAWLHPATPDGTAGGTGGTGTPAPSKTAITGQRRTQLETTATRLEHAMRDWGTDPTITPDSLKGLDAADALNRLRGHAPDPHALDGMLATPMPDGAGPAAPNPNCSRTGQPMWTCATWADAGAWWAGQAWGYGARWTDGPHVDVTGTDSVEVTGTVTAIMVGQDTFTSTSWSAITPAWRQWPIHDTITFDRAMRADVTHANDDPWWVDPLLTVWDGTMAGRMDTGTRVAIPVTGSPDWPGLMWDGVTEPLEVPATMGDLDGRVDWRLWDGLALAGLDDAQKEQLKQQCARDYGGTCPLF